MIIDKAKEIEEKTKEIVKKEVEQIREEAYQRTLGYIIAALGFIAGLAWNDAVGSLIQHFFPFSKDTVLAKFIYALIVTIVVVLISIYLSRLNRKK